jgi:hypothetical protein
MSIDWALCDQQVGRQLCWPSRETPHGTVRFIAPITEAAALREAVRPLVFASEIDRSRYRQNQHPDRDHGEYILQTNFVRQSEEHGWIEKST